MSASLSRHSEIAVLPSLPPSPSLLDEVFGHPGPWSSHEEFDLHSARPSSPGSAGIHPKGKRKQTIEVEDDEDDEEAQHHMATVHDAYPPRNNEAAETRRVEETLKRWELTDRERRKSARESVQYTSGPSFLSSLTRTATLVLSGRTSVGTSTSSGETRAFKSHETVNVAREGYAVPLDDIDRSRTSPSPSFERSVSLDAATGMVAGPSTPENPFVHPSERTRTPAPLLFSPATPTSMLPPLNTPSPSHFRDAHAQQAVHGDVTTRISIESHTDARKRSASSRTSVVPPPRPLGLPEHATHATQLQPTTPPVLQATPRGDPKDGDEAWWWHEWLCGCGEGPDRGGDNQAGRTNPFE